MIARKTNLPVSPPKHCIQRHHCLAKADGKCEINCRDRDGWRHRARDMQRGGLVLVPVYTARRG